MHVSRKLVAVVMADVVGYSRLMERDETGTHARLRELRQKLFEPKIAEHGGRTVKASGDGMLLEFPSATSALRCAVEVQQELAANNLPLPPDKRIELRVGINLGDIIVDGDDIIGDGVNVAQRLETLAEPGGICVASAVLEQLREDLGVEFTDLGEQQVKNISRPIRVFRVALDPSTSARTASSAGGALAAPNATTQWTRRRRTLSGILIAAIVVLGAVAVWHLNRQSAAVVTGTGPPARSVMVVPFRAPPDDAELRSVARVLTTDISRTLADTMRDVHVMSLDNAADRDNLRDLAPADYDRKARYVVDGEVRAAGDDVVIITRLLDTVLSRQLGSDRRVVARARFAQDQEQLTLRLRYAIRENFDNAERRRSAAPLPPNATARELVDRARMLTETASGEDLASVREARKLYDQAIERDPSLLAAWAGRTDVAWNEFLDDYKADPARLLAQMDRDSARAVDLDPQDPAAWLARHQALQFQSRFDAALAASDRVQALNPGYGFFLRGFLYIFSGRAADALALVQARNALLARNDYELELVSCDAYLHLGDYRQAIGHCEQSAAGNDTYWNYLNLAAAYAQAGDMAKGAAARDELMRRVPEFTIARYKAKQWSTDPTWVRQNEEHLIAGLRKAGVPE